MIKHLKKYKVKEELQKEETMLKIKKQVTSFIFRIILFSGIILPQTSNAQNYEDSKFGIFGAYATEYTWFQTQMGYTDTDYWNWVDEHFENLGTHWTRSNSQLIWDLIEPDLDGVYNWNINTNPDSVITNVYDSPANVNWLGCINIPSSSERNVLSYPTEWQNFLKAVVERYNGDGVNDLNAFVNAKYWQIGNEIMDTQNSYTSAEYAQIVALSESAIHSVDLTAKICLVAPTQASTPDTFLVNTIIELSNMEVNFDIIDIHNWRNYDFYKMNALPLYRTVLNNNGFTSVEIWSCEHGTHCYQPDNTPYQTKTEQASSLLKRYVWNLNNGLDKLFWNNLIEWHGFSGLTGSIFNSMGLIGDGSYCGEPTNEFNYIRKSYYSYKILAENIDADKALFIDNNSFHNELSGNYGYIYQDLNTNDNFEIFWTDNASASYAITLATDYNLTNMVPSDTLGNFATQSLSAGNHNITIYKDEVYVLKKTGISSVSEIQNSIYNIYPNPTTGIFTLEGKNIKSVKILNINGQSIKQLSKENEQYIFDLRGQPKGIYIIKIVIDKGIITKKIVLQ